MYSQSRSRTCVRIKVLIYPRERPFTSKTKTRHMDESAAINMSNTFRLLKIALLRVYRP